MSDPDHADAALKLTPRDRVRLHVLRNALYHTSRRMTFDRWNRWCSFFVILLGATAVSNLGNWLHWSWLSMVASFLTAAVGALQLVFDFGSKARDHQLLQKAYYHLAADIAEVTIATPEQVSIWDARMTRIAGDEPPTLRALDAKAYNDALSGTGLLKEDQRLVIPVWHRLLGQFWAFEGYEYKRVCEMKPKG